MNNKIAYHKVGVYYLPNLYLEKDEYEKHYQIGKYGHLRLEYLKMYKKDEYYNAYGWYFKKTYYRY